MHDYPHASSADIKEFYTPTLFFFHLGEMSYLKHSANVKYKPYNKIFEVRCHDSNTRTAVFCTVEKVHLINMPIYN